MALIQEYFNTAIIPALARIGFLKGDLHFEFEPTEDLSQLHKITVDLLPYYTIDHQWAKQTFGIEITGERNAPLTRNMLNQNLKEETDFFV